MRSSSLLIPALLFLCIPLALLAANPSSSVGGGGSASSSHASSGGGYGGGGSMSSRSYSSPTSSPSSHGSSVSHTSSARDVRGANGIARAHDATSTKAAQPEKKGFFSFLRHPQKKQEPVVANLRQPPCRQKPCPVPCPGGGLRGKNGACAVVANNTCSPGQSWNGYVCGAYWSNSCETLARQVEAQRRQMQGGLDPGQSLIYRTLRDQYEQCVRRYGYAYFGSYAYNGASLFDIP
jgi:hypothetical protein